LFVTYRQAAKLVRRRLAVTRLEKNDASFHLSGFQGKVSCGEWCAWRPEITIESGGRTMRSSRKDIANNWADDKRIAARYAPIHGMVTELLARPGVDEYAALVEELRAEWKPAGWEIRVVELMAELACRIRGCQCLETEILSRSIELCATPQEPPDMALGRAFIRDFEGPRLLDKLSRYTSRLSKEFSRCLRILELRAKSRTAAEANMAATLAKSKPCTSVIQ